MNRGPWPSATTPPIQSATIFGVLSTLAVLGSATGPLPLQSPTSLAGWQPPPSIGNEHVSSSSFLATHPRVGTATRLSTPASALTPRKLRRASPESPKFVFRNS